MNAEEQAELIKSVFNTVHGEKLLEVMLHEYVLAPIFSKDPHELAYRAGMQDFVTNLVLQTGATDDE